MIFTMFSDKRGLDAHAQDATAEELAEFIKTTRRDVRDKLPLIKFALFGKKRSDKGCLRYDENVTEITGIEADYDGGAASIEEAAEIARQVGLDCVIYSSPPRCTNGVHRDASVWHARPRSCSQPGASPR